MLLNVLRAYEEAATALSPRERRQWCKDHHFSQKTLSGVLDARKQLKERVDRLGLHSAGGAADGGEQTDNEDGILRCLLEGLFTNTAMRMPDNSYRRVMGTMVCGSTCAQSLFMHHLR
jgi:ATP-dependent RNA helicase DHX33